MERRIDITKLELLNPWIAKSINLFNSSSYLDSIMKIYPLEVAKPNRLNPELRRNIILEHNARNSDKLLNLLQDLKKFPYDDPIWYLLKNVEGCLDKNPLQVERIAQTLYSMTAEETVVRLESAPKLNTQLGPKFKNWLDSKFKLRNVEEFKASKKGIILLEASEEVAKKFVDIELDQNLSKRPDLLAKVNETYIIGEAKWIGQPGGNQGKAVVEVIDFCKQQRGDVRRVGIVDGFPWAVRSKNGAIINNKEAVLIQESEYDILSALLLEEYLESFNSVHK